MNRISKILIASAFATMSFAGASYAADGVAMNWPAHLDETLATFDQSFNVKSLSDTNNDDDFADVDGFPLSSGAVQQVQAAIRANEPLMLRMDERGIDVNDVVNAQRAADGSMTFWLR
ncbi:hypothetical protein FJU08_21255 [Martelella alba]|uniref:Uncharacterized protein n=1 Tax=Martelella alba TaxID=2590451 RepID=A0A506U1R0_9HYPH|nr:hypothetical protein [Martelella alba]TPW26964.1 hypothetical protein FJU08_21255 [Martelella alba]